MTKDPQSVLSMSLPQREAAGRHAMAALKQNPKNIEALLTMSALALSEGSTSDALGWLKKAYAVKKKSPDILKRLATTALAGKDYRSAKKYGRKLCEIEPRNADNHQTYGNILEQAGDPQGAIKAYKTRLRLKPDDAETFSAIARCHGFQGNHDEARRYHEKTLELAPYHAQSLYGLANSTRFGPGEADVLVDKLETAAGHQEKSDGVAQLFYSAGKVLEDAKDFPRAFGFYKRANEAARPENEGIHLESFENMEKAFTPELMRAKRGFGLDTRQAIFVLGMPRSGTTLTESICAAHSKVTARDELPYITTISEALGATSETPGPFVRAIAEVPPQGAVAMAQDYLANAIGAEDLDTPHFTDKMPHNFRYIGLIKLILPNAPIIHVRRHPLDNCLSIFANSMTIFHNTYKTDLVRLGLHYRRYHRLMRHWKYLLPGQIHDVFYEDLVANTELNARKLIDHIGLDWEDGVMDRSGSQRSVRTLSVWQVRQPVYDSSKGKWRRYEKELAPLMEILAPVVEEYEAELTALERENTT